MFLCDEMDQIMIFAPPVVGPGFVFLSPFLKPKNIPYFSHNMAHNGIISHPMAYYHMNFGLAGSHDLPSLLLSTGSPKNQQPSESEPKCELSMRQHLVVLFVIFHNYIIPNRPVSNQMYFACSSFYTSSWQSVHFDCAGFFEFF